MPTRSSRSHSSSASKSRSKSRSGSRRRRSSTRSRSRSPDRRKRRSSPVRGRRYSPPARRGGIRPARRRSPISRRKSRSRSPRRRSRSPRRRSRSPRKRSRSPRKRSRSPRKRSRSPRKRSTSPRKRSNSPRKKSRSPRKKSAGSRSKSRSGSKSSVRSESPHEVEEKDKKTIPPTVGHGASGGSSEKKGDAKSSGHEPKRRRFTTAPNLEEGEVEGNDKDVAAATPAISSDEMLLAKVRDTDFLAMSPGQQFSYLLHGDSSKRPLKFKELYKRFSSDSAGGDDEKFEMNEAEDITIDITRHRLSTSHREPEPQLPKHLGIARLHIARGKEEGKKPIFDREELKFGLQQDIEDGATVERRISVKVKQRGERGVVGGGNVSTSDAHQPQIVYRHSDLYEDIGGYVPTNVGRHVRVSNKKIPTAIILPTATNRGKDSDAQSISRTIEVGNVVSHLPTGSFRSLFEMFGEIEQLDMLPKLNSARITYQSIEGAQLALTHMQDKPLGGRYLTIQYLHHSHYHQANLKPGIDKPPQFLPVSSKNVQANTRLSQPFSEVRLDRPKLKYIPSKLQTEGSEYEEKAIFEPVLTETARSTYDASNSGDFRFRNDEHSQHDNINKSDPIAGISGSGEKDSSKKRKEIRTFKNLRRGGFAVNNIRRSRQQFAGRGRRANASYKGFNKINAAHRGKGLAREANSKKRLSILQPTNKIKNESATEINKNLTEAQKGATEKDGSTQPVDALGDDSRKQQTVRVSSPSIDGECYFYQTSNGCHFGVDCRNIHNPEHKGRFGFDIKVEAKLKNLKKLKARKNRKKL